MLDVVHTFSVGFALTCALFCGLRVGFWLFCSRAEYLYHCEVFGGSVVLSFGLLVGILFVLASYMGKVVVSCG